MSGSASATYKNPDPDPHLVPQQSDEFDQDRIQICINLQMTSQNVWNMSQI
jgi:hypothetical protein